MSSRWSSNNNTHRIHGNDKRKSQSNWRNNAENHVDVNFSDIKSRLCNINSLSRKNSHKLLNERQQQTNIDFNGILFSNFRRIHVQCSPIGKQVEIELCYANVPVFPMNIEHLIWCVENLYETEVGIFCIENWNCMQCAWRSLFNVHCSKEDRQRGRMKVCRYC